MPTPSYARYRDQVRTVKFHRETRTLRLCHTVTDNQAALAFHVIEGSYRKREVRLIRGICKTFPLRDVRGRDGLHSSER